METNRLLQFRVVVETGNVRKASELLGISHGGLSKSLKTFEAELGFPLLVPSGRGIVISDEGMRLYERSKNFLEEWERLMGKGASAPDDTVRIGSFEVFATYFMGPLLKDHMPDDVTVEVHEIGPGRLEEALLFHKVDVGITYEPIPRKGIEYVKASRILMGAYGLEGKFRDLDLEKIPFVVPVSPLEGAPSGVRGLDGWPDEKIERNVRYRVDLMATGLEIALQGLAAIFIPKFVARLHNERAAASFQLEAMKLHRGAAHVVRQVYIVKREATAENKIVREVAKALRKICTE